jgi:hypothetical protein
MTKIAIPLTPQQLARRFRPYAVELGYLIYSWNRLQEVLARLFWQLTGMPDRLTALAVWYAVPSDRTQRDMLRAALEASHEKRLKDFPTARADISWLMKKANDLSVQRNDAVHAPLKFEQSSRGAKLRSAHLGGHPRALRLRDKDLMTEFRWYADSADALSLFAEKAFHCLAGVPNQQWPTRPVIPQLEQYVIRRARSGRKNLAKKKQPQTSRV